MTKKDFILSQPTLSAKEIISRGKKRKPKMKLTLGHVYVVRAKNRKGRKRYPGLKKTKVCSLVTQAVTAFRRELLGAIRGMT